MSLDSRNLGGRTMSVSDEDACSLLNPLWTLFPYLFPLFPDLALSQVKPVPQVVPAVPTAKLAPVPSLPLSREGTGNSSGTASGQIRPATRPLCACSMPLLTPMNQEPSR